MNTPDPCRYHNGDRKGQLTVLIEPMRDLRGQTKPRWWMMVQCQCGHVQWMHQNQLDRRIDCERCYADRRGEKTRKDVKPDDAPRFERMRW